MSLSLQLYSYLKQSTNQLLLFIKLFVHTDCSAHFRGFWLQSLSVGSCSRSRHTNRNYVTSCQLAVFQRPRTYTYSHAAQCTGWETILNETMMFFIKHRQKVYARCEPLCRHHALQQSVVLISLHGLTKSLELFNHLSYNRDDNSKFWEGTIFDSSFDTTRTAVKTTPPTIVRCRVFT